MCTRRALASSVLLHHGLLSYQHASGMNLRHASDLWKMMVTPGMTDDVHNGLFNTPQRRWEEKSGLKTKHPLAGQVLP